MEFSLSELTGRERDKLMHSVVVPRPIALITTRSAGGVNAAPYSFFNVLSGDPPIVAVGISETLLQGGGPKDTAVNILRSREFVVNTVTEAMIDPMRITAVDMAFGVDELAAAGLRTTESVAVAPPRLLDSPASLECRLRQTIRVTPHRYIFLADVVHVHVDDSFVLDPDRLYLATSEFGHIARMHGNGWYSRTTDLFQAPRL